ncbi:hypothetical protein COX59_03520, partial [Candidatus Beckwithbacteria bacterium CG_4_10_14_0_2_um_filter_47_25]
MFSTALAVFGYNQIFKEAGIGQAYPQAPSPAAPNRYLSFQARLTDSSDNPITTPTDVRFIVYNNETASGSAKLWEELRYIDPDQDGIFSVTLGTEQSIASSVFTENVNLWLGVTVEVDPEATPRQRIATVGYALNAETLQGFPPSASASADQIPVLTQEGDLVLAAASPMVYSSSGTFAIKGQALTITTDTGTNGAITIAPDGTGSLNLTGSTTTQNFIRATNANLTSGHLISGYVGNDTATGDLLNLSSGASETEKFTVDRSGQCIEENSLISTSAGYKKIKDIVPNDQVLSLNETTGQFEYQTVEKTLDMGRKEIYELTTETGKKIETTANHPYLTKKSAEADLVSLADSLTDGPDNLETNISSLNQLVKSPNIRGVDLPGVEPGRRGLSGPSSEPAKPTPNQFWVKVIYLSIGDAIATIDGFEKI